MTNLLDQLKPEILELINLDAEKYPNYVDAMKKELTSCYSFLQLSVNTASNICAYANKEFSILGLSKCFVNN